MKFRKNCNGFFEFFDPIAELLTWVKIIEQFWSKVREISIVKNLSLTSFVSKIVTIN